MKKQNLPSAPIPSLDCHGRPITNQQALDETTKARFFLWWSYLIIIVSIVLMVTPQSIYSETVIEVAKVLAAVLSIGWVGVVAYLSTDNKTNQ